MFLYLYYIICFLQHAQTDKPVSLLFFLFLNTENSSLLHGLLREVRVESFVGSFSQSLENIINNSVVYIKIV